MRKRRWFLAVLACASAMGHAETVDAIRDDVRAHGFARPEAVIRRLLRAEDAPSPAAPAQDRALFFQLLDRFAQLHDDPASRDRFHARLRQLAGTPHCPTCWLALRLSDANRQLAESDPAGARHLEAAVRLLPWSDADQRVQFFLLRARSDALRRDLSDGIANAVAARRHAEAMGDRAAEVDALGVLIGLNADGGNFDRAYRTAREAERLAASIGYVYALPELRARRAYVLGSEGRLQEQRAALEQLLPEAARDGRTRLETVTLVDLADAALRVGNAQRALAFATRAEALALRVGDPTRAAVARANRGVALSRLGRHADALRALASASHAAHALGVPTYAAGVDAAWADACEAAGQPGRALALLKDVRRMEHVIQEANVRRTDIEVQERYEAERREHEIARLAAETRAQRADAQRRRWQVGAGLLAFLLLSIVVAHLVARLCRSRRTNRHLHGRVERLARESSLDALTGAYNRRHAQLCLDRCASASIPVGLVLLDIDRFKQVNDTWGHGAGDAMLVEIARRLGDLLRSDDTVVRWGGEEFLLLLPNMTREAMPSLLRRILSAIGGAAVVAGAQRLRVTASAGATLYDSRDDADWKAAIALADSALYRAKRGGRNQAIAAWPAPGTPAGALEDLDQACALGTVVLHPVAGPDASAA